jgi:hypothetical protein
MLTFLIAFIIGYLEEKVGMLNLIFGSIFTLIIISITMVIFANFSKLSIKDEYEENNEILKGFITAQGLGDLISEHELARLESQANSIWVFSLDLSNDIGIEGTNEQNNEIFEAVKKNLQDGKQYTYFIPDEPVKYGAIEEFKKKHTYEPNQVKFCLIPIKEFHIVSEIAIYDNSTAIQWFPSKNMNYYIKLDPNYMMNIIGSGKLLLSKYFKEDL